MTTPVDIVSRLLANATDENVVRELVSSNATYVSLCYSNPDLKKIMPYAGEHFNEGPEAIIYTFKTVNKIWKNEMFNIDVIFGDGENVAVFGKFTYRSSILGKAYTSPFSVRATVENGQVTYMQFMEDTFGTGATFAKSGSVVYEVDEGATFSIDA